MKRPVKHWRDTDYRSDFFRKNPGLKGSIWFCAYCGKPLVGQRSVQVDHVLPPSRVAKKKYKKGALVKNTSALARALNGTMNLVASCKKCNMRKSDKVGVVSVRGMVGKVGQTVTSKTPRFLRFVPFVAGAVMVGGLRIITSPLSLFSSKKSKIILILVLAGIIYFLIR